ncbi:uncharacterized protein LOC128667143 [Bombina bombina]|uniref:uncharacterized protein LOC128667143 n=1 Tax=Bombina bombina TaxID=8345 RepID=UPI00235B308D|nr:uncharacterized protein LOC128667143 [Bombina bombina]
MVQQGGTGVLRGSRVNAEGAQGASAEVVRGSRVMTTQSGSVDEWSGAQDVGCASGVPIRAGASTSTPFRGGSHGGHVAGLDTPLSFVSSFQDTMASAPVAETSSAAGAGTAVQAAGRGSAGAASESTAPSTSAAGGLCQDSASTIPGYAIALLVLAAVALLAIFLCFGFMIAFRRS